MTDKEFVAGIAAGEYDINDVADRYKNSIDCDSLLAEIFAQYLTRIDDDKPPIVAMGQTIHRAEKDDLGYYADPLTKELKELPKTGKELEACRLFDAWLYLDKDLQENLNKAFPKQFNYSVNSESDDKSIVSVLQEMCKGKRPSKYVPILIAAYVGEFISELPTWEWAKDMGLKLECSQSAFDRQFNKYVYDRGKKIVNKGFRSIYDRYIDDIKKALK